MKLKIIIADDHEILRDGLRSLLEKEDWIEIVAEAQNGREVIDKAKKHKPDMIIIDITMPELNGIDATKKLLEMNRNLKIIALSVHSDRRFVGEMFKAGARGYLIKDCAYKELLQALQVVNSNQIYISPSIANVVVSDYIKNLDSEKSSVMSILTSREREVLQLLAEGNSTKEVAFALGISGKTAEAHRRQIMEKLNIRSIAELTKYAIKSGLTNL